MLIGYVLWPFDLIDLNFGYSWYDKSLSLLVPKDGVAAINFEHSWGDGVAILRLFNEIHKDTTINPLCHPEDLAATSETAADDSADSVFLLRKQFLILHNTHQIVNCLFLCRI